MEAGEGCASISDQLGNIIFYTNGVSVWDKNDQVMPNGQGLNGHLSSSQSAIIVKQPSNDSIYYIFTVDELAGAKGLCYSIVNIHSNNGNGDVVVKNFFLTTTTCEKITAVKHCNNNDIWVLTRKFNSDEFLSYLLTSTGLSTTPIISHTGNFVTTITGTLGYLKSSPDGKKIAAAHGVLEDYIELCDFNNGTGNISNSKKLIARPSISLNPANGVYGIEFSADSKFLYSTSDYIATSDTSYIYQFDASLTTQAAVQNSAFQVCKYNYGTNPTTFGALQLGPDKKIYTPMFGRKYLSVIENPTLPGVLCNFKYNYVNLGNGSNNVNYCQYGLPTFVQSYFNDPIIATGNCLFQNVSFSITNGSGIDSVKWDFNDISTGALNYSTSLTPTHLFSNQGLFKINLILFYGTGCSDTLYKNILPGPLKIFIGADTSICRGDTLMLKMNIPNTHNYWSNGSSDTILKVYTTGTYWVKVRSGDCEAIDSINVTIKELPQFTLGNDTVICNSTSVTLSPNPVHPNVSYLWNTNLNTSSILTNTAGDYWLRVTDNNGCKWRDTIKVSFKTLPGFNLGIDTSICDKDSLLLNATVSGANGYLWNNGITLPMIKAFQQNIYWCNVSKDGCIFRDSLTLSIKPLPIANLGNDVTLCEDNTLLLDATNSNSIYLWQDASTSPTYLVKQKGQYRVRVTMNGCISRDTISIEYNLKPKFTLGDDSRLCLGSKIILNPQIAGVSYLWQDGSTNPTYTVTQPGLYRLTATNSCGPTIDDIIIGNGVCNLYVPNSFTPNGDGKNDLFKASNGDNVTEFHLQVFNRYGQIVFFTKDKNKGWDGNFAGSKQPFGTYVWLIQYKTVLNSDLQNLQGTVLLIH